MKSRDGQSQRREEKRRRRRKSQKKEDPGARKGKKFAKSRFAKAAGAEPAGQMRDEKLHAVVARSTFASEKGQNASRSEHFLKLRCRKSARGCGAKTFRSQNVKSSDHFFDV